MGRSIGPSQKEPTFAPDEHYYRHLCEHAGIAMISTDCKLLIRTWNASAAQMFGASASSMIGTSIVSVIPTEGREQGRHLIRHSIDDCVTVHYHFEHRDEHGQPRVLTVTLSPVIDDAGTVLGALACFRDITRRAKLEHEVAKRNRLAGLGQMAGAVAHHLNNMLGGAVTSVDFALGTDIASLQNRALRQTGEALARAGRLLNGLLAFAEGDSRQVESRELHEVIHEVMAKSASRIADAKISVDFRLDLDANPEVPRGQFVTVLENIVQNAEDAMPGGGTLTIGATQMGGATILTIADSGCGMDAESVDRVFEPFYSTKSRTLDFENHPGLGMAVAHGILQYLGHDVSVASTPGTGTRVTIHLGTQDRH